MSMSKDAKFLNGCLEGKKVGVELTMEEAIFSGKIVYSLYLCRLLVKLTCPNMKKMGGFGGQMLQKVSLVKSAYEIQLADGNKSSRF
ncbi:pyruvate oxidase [Sesbania bispinosa]|nr:pyruvate oxidase [Sesbania bispinosa]